MSANIGKASLKFIGNPFVDCVLRGPGSLGRVTIASTSNFCGGAVIGDGFGEGGPLTSIELLQLCRLLAPMARFAFLKEQEAKQSERGGEPGNSLHVEESENHSGASSRSASNNAPSRLALSFNRPTGPPARRPAITTIMAAMKPPSDQPNMVTIVCSSALDQPPHINSVIVAMAHPPQNIPAAAASRP